MQHRRTDRRTHHRAALLAPLLAAAAAAPVAQAGPLADPTRPPAALMAAQPQGPGASAAGTGAGPTLALRSAAASAPAAAPPPVPESVLQSVQLPVRGPAVALVDGRLVKAGDKVGKRTVLTIDSQGLVLRGDTGNERLWLLAGNGKQAPGSIVTTHTASFVPASQAPDAAQELDAHARTERGGAGPRQPGQGAALSLAGRTQP